MVNKGKDPTLEKLLSFPSYFEEAGNDAGHTAPLLTPQQAHKKRLQEEDELITRLPYIMWLSGYQQGGALMAKWQESEQPLAPPLRARGRGSPAFIEWHYLRKFDRVNDALGKIDQTVSGLDQSEIGNAGYFTAGDAVPAALDKARDFIKNSDGLLTANGASNTYRLYVGSEQISYLGAIMGNRDFDDLDVAMGRFPIKVHLVGRFLPRDENRGAHPFEFDAYEVSVSDSFDFGRENETGWKDQYLGRWGMNGFNDPAGINLYNSTFRNYRDRNGKGLDFDVEVNPDARTLPGRKVIYVP